MARATPMLNTVLASQFILDSKPKNTKAMSTQKTDLVDLVSQRAITLETKHIERLVVLSGKVQITV